MKHPFLPLKAMALTLLCAIAPVLHAAANNGTVTVTTPAGRTVTVKAVNDNIFRIVNTPRGVKGSATQAAVLPVQTFKGAVASDSVSYTIMLPSGVGAVVNKATGAVSFINREGELASDNGIRTSNDSIQSLSITTRGAGVFYGAGERGHSFKLNGDTLVMYNRQNYGYTEGDPRISQMNITVPYFVSTDGYGILFDDYAAATLVLADPVTYSSEASAPVSYYFVYGGSSLADVTEQFTALTGHQELPPFYALGYITSKYGYRTADETRGVIDTLKTQGYPVDGVVLDLYWYGQETDMGRLEWNPEQWGDHKKMLADLKDLGVNTIIISQPYINKIGALDNYNELASKGLLTKNAKGEINDVTTWVGEAGMFDVANPDTRRWLRERYRTLTDEGVAGWWGDLGEPEVHPESIVHHNGESARRYHNVYGNVWSSIIYDLFKDEYPDRRLMTLMRGGTTGLQRYSVFPWSTDVSRSWGGLQPQVKIMLNSGLSGLAYMSHDVGGFAIDEDHPVDPELYLRWLQLGLFSPVLRTHAQKFAEPYHYPEYADALLDLVKMRYRWLPYNYTLAYENALHGYPLVRPLNFMTPEDSTVNGITDEYLWGNEVLVAPVLTQGAKSRRVVLPQGMWIDYNDPAVDYTGPATIEYALDSIEVIPLFVREGAFIPQAPYAMENTADYDPSCYEVLYYPRTVGESGYTMFEDNRRSTASLAEGEYQLIDFHGTVTDTAITVNVEVNGTYDGAPESKEITLVLPGITLGSFKNITVNGNEVVNFLSDNAPTAEQARHNAQVTFTVAPGNPATIVLSRRLSR